MSKIPENVFKEIINYPFLYDQTNPDYADSRKCCWAWEQIAKTRWNTEWTNLTLSEKTKKGRIILYLNYYR